VVNLEKCVICGNSEFIDVYKGPIRDGSFERKIGSSRVYRCAKCDICRIPETDCFKQNGYESELYREEMNQGLSVREFYEHADPIQIYHLESFWPFSYRNKVVADIGCGAGSFVDHISGLTSEILAVEPTKMYHKSLTDRGYKVFSYAHDALKEYKEKVDIVVSFQVIEHVEDPVLFLKEIFSLLKKDGILILATPNRNDILMKLLPDLFPSFFYRSQHRWYFNEKSLRHCIEKSGFSIVDIKQKHTFGLSNAFAWLRDKKPKGNVTMEGINQSVDTLWKDYLETSKQADTVFVMAQKYD